MSDTDDMHPSFEPDEAGPSDVNKKSKGDKINKKLSKKALEKLKAEDNRKGIIYISRIPPHLVSVKFSCMPPPQIASLLVIFATVRHNSQSYPTCVLLQKPQKLRHMLEQHAEIGRVYLAPEGLSLCHRSSPAYH